MASQSKKEPSWQCQTCSLVNNAWDSECTACFTEKPFTATHGDITYRWGIIGCGKISHDFCNNLDVYQRAEVTACAARSVESAETFARKFGIPNAFGSYAELAESEDVDVVYVGTIHPSHYENVIMCLEKGKHVVCEKPLGMNMKQVEAMYECARRSGKLLLEGMWTRFFPGFQQVRQWLAAGVIGDLVAFQADFGIRMPSPEEAPRLWQKQLGGGCMLDLGCYVVAPIACFFGMREPSEMKVSGSVLDGFDTSFQVIMNFENGDTPQFATISSTFYTTTPEEWVLSGTKGRIHISQAHHPTRVKLVPFDGAETVRNYSPDDKFKLYRHDFNFSNGPGFMFQVDGVTRALDGGLTECPEFTAEESIFTNRMMERILGELGVSYEEFEAR